MKLLYKTREPTRGYIQSLHKAAGYILHHREISVLMQRFCIPLKQTFVECKISVLNLKFRSVYTLRVSTLYKYIHSFNLLFNSFKL